jgi:hypothetical protein
VAKGAGRAVAALSEDKSDPAGDDLLDLQRTAGNRAVALAVQRDKKPDVDSLGIPVDRLGLPKRGPDVRTELRDRLPGLMAALTESQLDQWQQVVDYSYIDTVLRKKEYDLDFGTMGPQVGFPGRARPPTHAYYGELWSQTQEYKGKKRQLDAARARLKRPSSTPITVDPRLLLADDVHEQPKWDVKAETAFRDWAVAEIVKNPITIDTAPSASWYEALGQWPITVRNTKGFITIKDLQFQYQAEYRAWVSERKEVGELDNVLHMIRDAIVEMKVEHKERSDINARKIGFGLVRHISEAVGSGSTPYPSIKIWDQPEVLCDRAITAFNKGQFELAVTLMSMAETTTADAITKYTAYEKRVQSGAGRVVKVLEVMKLAGTIAAGVASGGLGLTGAALAAGGYEAAQEAASRASEMYYGQRKDFDLAGLVTKAGVTTVMTLMGGALQGKFEAALKLRFDKIGMTGSWFSERAISAVASGTSSVYMTATEAVIRNIVEGKALPTSASEFADMVVDNAVRDVGMDFALSGLNKRAAQEYHNWKTGKAGPATAPAMPGTGAATAPGGKAPAGAPAPDPARTAKAAEEAPRQMPEHAVRSLLKEGGGWERLKGELETGTGLGANMAPAERQALVDRFESHRETLARNAASVFAGEVVVSDSPTGGHDIEVRFTGPEGPAHLNQAQAYLDAKSPGWSEQTSVKLSAPVGPESTRSPRTERVVQALEYRLTDAARSLAGGFVPIYERWGALKTPEKRFEAMLDVVNKQLVAAGAPPLMPNFLHKPRPEQYGALEFKVWELNINRDLLSHRDPTPAEFAAACDTLAHEARHALQWFRMARINPQGVGATIDPQALKAAREANQGLRRAERLEPGQAKYEQAQEFYQSVYGTGSTDRAQIYADKKARITERDTAYKELQDVMHLPLNDPLRRQAELKYMDAEARADEAHERYEYLPEEIDARRHGQAVAQAVQQQIRTLQVARVGARDAYARFKEAEAKALQTRPRDTLEQRKAAREEAFRRYEAATNIVQRLEEKIAAKAPKVP